MEPLDHRTERILRLSTYLDNHLSEALSVNMLAAQACYSPFHFERVFGDEIGMTPMDYVRLRRLIRAGQRVRHEKKTSLLRLAQECGYASNASFSRGFRQHFGYSPRDWRQGAWHDFMSDNCARKNDWNLRHDSPKRRKYLDYWDIEWRRWDVGSRVEVRHLLPATLWYRRCIGEIGISSFRLFEHMFEAFTRSGYATADTVWCSSWTEDLRFVSPMHEVGDLGVLAQGDPPSGLLSRTVPGGIYAVLETRGEPVLPHWMHEDWLDRQSRWTADMTRPYLCFWRESPEDSHSASMRLAIPIRAL